MNKEKIKALGKEMYQGMQSGISYMIPVVIAGALIQAIPNLWTAGQAASATEGLAYYMYTWGSSIFGLMYYFLAMYTAFGIAGRPALVSGLVVGWFSVTTNAGFLGAVVGGLIAGYITRYTIKWLKLPQVLGAAKSILFVPIITSFIMMCLMEFILVPVCGWIMDLIYAFGIWVDSIGYKPLLCAVFGACFCFGMGGPVCYGMLPVALMYIAEGDLVVAAATCISATCGCLGTGLAVLLFPKKFNEEERASVVGAFTGWLVQITEFQIPFFVNDLKTFTPAYILAGAVGGAMCAFVGLEMPAFHGGIFNMLMSNNLLLMVLCSLTQAAVVVLWVFLFKKDIKESE